MSESTADLTPDELALLVRSYADQAARRFDGVTVKVEPYDDRGLAGADVAFTGPESLAARAAAAKLIDGDKTITAFEEWEEDGAHWLGVIAMSPDEWEDSQSPPPPPEEEELAEQLDMPEGPMDVRIKGWPECVPNAKTKVVVVGLDLAGRGWKGEAYWDGEFADLERARYWALKRERDHKAKGFRASASVYWQHAVTKEEAVARVVESMNAKG